MPSIIVIKSVVALFLLTVLEAFLENNFGSFNLQLSNCSNAFDVKILENMTKSMVDDFQKSMFDFEELPSPSLKLYNAGTSLYTVYFLEYS